MVQVGHPQKFTLQIAELGQFVKNLPLENFLLYGSLATYEFPLSSVFVT